MKVLTKEQFTAFKEFFEKWEVKGLIGIDPITDKVIILVEDEKAGAEIINALNEIQNFMRSDEYEVLTKEKE